MQEPSKHPPSITEPVTHAYAAAMAARDAYKDFEGKLEEHHPQVAQSLRKELDNLNTRTDHAQRDAAAAKHEADKKQGDP